MADFQQLPASYQAFVARSYVLGLMTGYPDGTFRGSAVLSRAQGATLLLRTLDLSSGAVLEQETAEKDLAPAQTQTDSAQAHPVELRTLGENGAKRERLFGSAEKRRFTDQAEARTNMTEVTVPVWRLNESTGEKTAGEVTFMIHKALAADMTEIFTEIFNDPEQFPVKDIGGFRWTDGAKGEHNCGTAIDINWNENYQVYPNGTVGAGAYWAAGQRPLVHPCRGKRGAQFQGPRLQLGRRRLAHEQGLYALFLYGRMRQSGRPCPRNAGPSAFAKIVEIPERRDVRPPRVRAEQGGAGRQTFAQPGRFPRSR